MTGKEAIECVNKLKEFCKSKKNCSRCPFRIKYNEFEDCCSIACPYYWNAEKQKERKRKEIEERDAMLDEYYGTSKL